MLASVMLLALAVLSALMLMSVWNQKFWRKMPPGPIPLPLIGNYLQLDAGDMYNALMKMSEHYGPVFLVHLGLRRIVVLCGYHTVKEALVDQAEEFSGRGQQATFNTLFDDYGLALSNGERAKQMRRFAITTLRDFGVGKRGIEERIQEEASFLIKRLRGTNGAFIDPTFYLSQTVSNVISSVVFGDRFDYEDEELRSLLKMMMTINAFAASPMGQIYDMFYSIMKYFPGPQRKISKSIQGLEEFITKKVEQNQRTLDPNSPRDFIDSFLIHMLEKKNPNTEFCMKNLVMSALSLFFAGSETTSSTLRYGFLLLLKHPEVEAKVHEEIDLVIGRNRQPQFEDRHKMPYTEAVIYEIQRFANFAPMGIPRRVTKDTRFRGFFLPKGTEVFPMLGSVLNDPKFFPNPGDFNPQHFLDDKGQFKKSDAFVPFSIGKRYCLGEGLAKMELFLLFTTILQNFRFKSPKAPQDIKVSPDSLGFTRILPKYTLSFLPL
ncbi:cytochrome P450 2A4-like isoform X2 [Perognathus longimembris pacificus]|uniref:cytochrome P450 2A4-like isoform X2 n=1 Tax=Perognathus longimembris pacificus TaxID=214514 RepID=UPI002018F702|nr:cytochrome P450 2A4-like isoform X2 [Perognathus longimembris pacificus]